MRKSTSTVSQIVAILGEHDVGLPIAEVCWKHGFSNALYCPWKSKYARVSVGELKRLREPEAENSRIVFLFSSETGEQLTHSVFGDTCTGR